MARCTVHSLTRYAHTVIQIWFRMQRLGVRIREVWDWSKGELQFMSEQGLGLGRIRFGVRLGLEP